MLCSSCIISLHTCLLKQNFVSFFAVFFAVFSLFLRFFAVFVAGCSRFFFATRINDRVWANVNYNSPEETVEYNCVLTI